MTIMKVLLLNGSPRKEGCTYTALTEIAKTLKKNGVEAEIFQAGDLLLPDRSSNSWINSLPRPERI